MAWSVTYTDIKTNISTTSYWVSEKDALRAVCSEIIASIKCRWPLNSQPETKKKASYINYIIKWAVSTQDLSYYWTAIGEFNSFSTKEYFTVVEAIERAFYGAIQPLDLGEETTEAPSNVQAQNDIAVINDHICTTCGNDRCSKNEKSCWKCGAKIDV